jgi:hypothetical protein
MTKRKSEYDNFQRTVAALLKVPHREIKAKLEEEKKEKEEEREKRKRERK